MRAVLISFALAVVFVTSAHATGPTAAEAWRPMHSFIGHWKGVRTLPAGPQKLTRGYASATSNQHLEITEKGADRSAPGVWGVVSFDPEKQVLVLRQFAADGAALDAALDPALSTDAQLVFASPADAATQLRITYVRSDAREFTERVERAENGGPFVVVSETKFVKKD